MLNWNEIIRQQKKVLSEDELMYKMQEISSFFPKYIDEQKKRGFCYQCIHPMYRGCCKCGKKDDISVKLTWVIESKWLVYSAYSGLEKFEKWSKLYKKNPSVPNIYCINKRMGEVLDDESLQYVIDKLNTILDEYAEKYKNKDICECDNSDDTITDLVKFLKNEKKVYESVRDKRKP